MLKKFLKKKQSEEQPPHSEYKSKDTIQFQLQHNQSQKVSANKLNLLEQNRLKYTINRSIEENQQKLKYMTRVKQVPTKQYQLNKRLQKIQLQSLYGGDEVQSVNVTANAISEDNRQQSAHTPKFYPNACNAATESKQLKTQNLPSSTPKPEEKMAENQQPRPIMSKQKSVEDIIFNNQMPQDNYAIYKYQALPPPPPTHIALLHHLLSTYNIVVAGTRWIRWHRNSHSAALSLRFLFRLSYHNFF